MMLCMVNLTGLYFEIIEATRGLDTLFLLLNLLSHIVFLAFWVRLFIVWTRKKI